MPDRGCFYCDHKLVEQIKVWMRYYKSMELTEFKTMTLIQRRRRSGKIYSNPKS